MDSAPVQIDAWLPPQIAERAEELGVKKAGLPLETMFILAVLAGAFIAMGAMLFTVVTTGAAGMLPFGLTRLVGGLAFSLGLVLVVVGGAELFTGNNLIVMAWASRRIGAAQVLRSWSVVYVGNFVGAVLSAVLVFFAGQHRMGGGAVGLQALQIAQGKLGLGLVQAFVLGVLCNALVCMAVWLAMSARSTTDRILAVVPPVTAFVAAGFEHSVANMYFVPLALLMKSCGGPELLASLGKVPADVAALSFSTFLLHNLLPVTLGNLCGGAGLVGIIYWLAYRRPARPTEAPRDTHP